MPSTLDLINAEKLAAVIFIISSFQALFSAFEAEKSELEKDEKMKVSEGVLATRLGLASTNTGILGYLIFLIVAILRKNQLEEEIRAGTKKTTTTPNIFIISGLIVAIIGGIMRLPGIQQRLQEATVPVIL